MLKNNLLPGLTFKFYIQVRNEDVKLLKKYKNQYKAFGTVGTDNNSCYLNIRCFKSTSYE